MGKVATKSKSAKKTITKKSAKVKSAVVSKKVAAKANEPTKIETILISQPEPSSPKSPYYNLEKKFNVKLDFYPFIIVEGITSKEFRKQKVDVQNQTAIIFTSRNAIDHFFRLCEELKVKVNGDMKYYCISEAVALYLQKFIVYRKRKIFFGEGGVDSMLQVILKHNAKKSEKFIVPVNDLMHAVVTSTFEENEIEYREAVLYRTVCNQCEEIINKQHDLLVFFSPSGVKSLFENSPNYKQGKTIVATFGPKTKAAAEEAGLTLDIEAPKPNMPSMVAALEHYLKSSN